ncbi:C-C motif chemokine 21b-like [Bombina bombina]|uniref:C-C motif chemokine 21b-like n=1 Tax=Bombina bombina TaxID=8345 RepID=UPI00235AF6AD|nr:C-C motif chemokine 21b-like [Bombina bombina]
MWTLLPLILAVLCNTAYMQGHAGTDCCLVTGTKSIPYNTLREYQIQSNSEGCPTSAIVFITKTSKKLCAQPGLKWVKKLMKKLDTKKKNEDSKKEKKVKKEKPSQKNSFQNQPN